MVTAQGDVHRRCDIRDLDGGGAVDGGPVPELAVAVPAPALHRAVRQQGTRMSCSQSDPRRVRDV